MQTSGEESRRSRLPRCGALLVGLSAVFGSLLLSSPAAALADHPVISEVLVEPSGRQSDYEFVEIYNPTGETVSIGGWTVPYKSASGTSFTTVAAVPSGRVIGPYGYFLIGGGKVTPVPDYTDRSLGFAALGGHIALLFTVIPRDAGAQAIGQVVEEDTLASGAGADVSTTIVGECLNEYTVLVKVQPDPNFPPSTVSWNDVTAQDDEAFVPEATPVTPIWTTMGF